VAEPIIDAVKVVLKVAASGGILTGAGWYIKYRFFDRPARDREFVVGVVKAGLEFLNVLEAQLTNSLWFEHECSDMQRASSDLKLRHANVDEAAAKYEQVLVEAHARLPARVVKNLNLPLGRWRLTRLLQFGIDKRAQEGRSFPDNNQWFQVFRKGVWDDLAHQRKLLAHVSSRY
jgi:hypothetical protein